MSKSTLGKEKKLPKTMVYTGNSDLDTRIAHYRYSKSSFEQLDHVNEPSDEHSDLIVVEGFKNKDEVIKLASTFQVNEFYVEDIFNVTQRNKIEVSDDQAFIVLKYALIVQDTLQFRRIYFILKKGLILVFTDYENHYVNTLLERVKNNIAMFTSYDESYIVYAIFDMIIDEQLEMTRVLKIELEDLESNIMSPSKTMSKDLFNLHKQFVQLRNNVSSLSENVSLNKVRQSEFFHDNLHPFISDLDDHISNLRERLSTNIEVCNSLINMYSTLISNKTNDVMKTLTIISVIFIPLSFVAGVFGMNFVNFNLLQNPNGLVIFGVFSVLIVIGMLMWFKYRKWL